MALQITVNNIASYKNPVDLNIDKKINFFYGLNGSGKTTIANFLQNPDLKRYCDCSISEGQDKEFIVYNENFVGENFYESVEQKGIFTLGIGNKEAKSNIESSQNQIKKLKEEIIDIDRELDKIKSDREKSKNKIKDHAWDIKRSYENSPLDFCLTGFKNNKDNFFEKILETEPEKENKVNFQSLESEINSLEGEDAVIKDEIQKININISSIEKNQIFQEIIVGSRDNPLSNLIEELNNSDWVKNGMNFLDAQTKCPFCQQELGDKIITNLRGYFDDTYAIKIDSLNGIRSQYQSEIDKIPELEELMKEKFVSDCHLFIDEFREFKTILDQNIDLIYKKIEEPSKKVELTNTKARLSKINGYITQINLNIQDYNKKTENKDKFKEKITQKFWKCARREFDPLIKIYSDKEIECGNKIQKLKSQRDTGIQAKINEKNEIISENLKKITNVESSIKNINIYLKYLAIDSFQIENSQDDFYRIVREHSKNDQFKSLSEGEKTIISFLYFLELCQGSISSESTVEKDKKVIIIDDPVSSLSHTYVFNIADLIKTKVIDMNYAHVCILTHNLFFFHEMCIRTKKAINNGDVGLYRLSKNIETQIRGLKKDEIQNDYSAYWRIIKDFDEDESSVSNSLLAISMRNIIEHFFTFINDRKDLNEVMTDIKNIDSNYSAFHRYMNRSSHSDSVNRSEINDIDPHIFRKAFAEVFKKTKYVDHYNKMIK